MIEPLLCYLLSPFKTADFHSIVFSLFFFMEKNLPVKYMLNVSLVMCLNLIQYSHFKGMNTKKKNIKVSFFYEMSIEYKVCLG